MAWYEEVLRIRNDANHYLMGSGVFKREADGKLVLQYISYGISERKEGGRNRKIVNGIMESANDMHQRFLSSVDGIGGAWLELVDPTVRCSIPIFHPDRTKMRIVSLEEYRAGAQGKQVGVFPLKNGKERIHRTSKQVSIPELPDKKDLEKHGIETKTPQGAEMLAILSVF